jgi:hypothetical protein
MPGVVALTTVIAGLAPHKRAERDGPPRLLAANRACCREQFSRVVCRSYADQDAAADGAEGVPAKEFGRTGKTLSRQRYSGSHTLTESWAIDDPPLGQADEGLAHAGDAVLGDQERLRARGCQRCSAKEGLIDDALRTGWLRQSWNHHPYENQESRGFHRPTIIALEPFRTRFPKVPSRRRSRHVAAFCCSCAATAGAEVAGRQRTRLSSSTRLRPRDRGRDVTPGRDRAAACRLPGAEARLFKG